MDQITLYAGEASSKETLSPATQQQPSPIQMVQEITLLIAPRSSSHVTANPFAYAELKDLSGKIQQLERSIGGGSFADVHMGYWVTDTTSTKVAIKELRSQIYNTESILKLEPRLRREMRIWGNLKHPNIVPFLGVTSDFGRFTAMVCRWMNQGTLAEYLGKEKSNLNLQDRLNLCIAIAYGLSYIHSQNVIHGDLTPANILIDNDTAHLSDFGLSNVIAELQGPSFLTSKAGGSTRWIAPELLLVPDDAEPELAKPCDVYSFANIACYIITGIVPYKRLKTDASIILEIYKTGGKSPSAQAQSQLTKECWEFLEMCWATDPAIRPDINGVIQRLQQLLFA